MGGQSFAGYAPPFLSPLPPFFSIFIGFPDGSPSPTRYGWEEVLWQYSVSYNDTAARSSALTVRSPFLLRSLNGILVTYDGLTSHPRREAELLLKGISCHRNPDKLLCLTRRVKLLMSPFDDICFCFRIWTAVQMAEVTITIPTRLSVAVTG